MSTVTEMKRPISEAKPSDVAVGTVMEFRIGEGASSLQLSSCFGRDDGLEVWNDVLDKMRKAGFRQAALVDIDSFSHAIIVQKREKQDAVELYERAERTFQEMMIQSSARIEAFQSEAGSIKSDDEMAFGTSGKRGDYKISQGASVRVQRIVSQIDHEEREQDKLKADRDGALRNHDSAMRDFDKKIAWFQSEIDRLTAAISE
jgi:uncharacterized protein YehS (DUF1456 family)